VRLFAIRHLPFAHYCTAAWKPFASCFIAVPCDLLAVSVVQRASVPHFAARLACLRVLATTAYAYLLLLLLLPPLLLPLRYLFCLCLTLPAYPLTSTNPPSQPASQPAISRTIASAARIPSIAFDPDSQPATGPSLPCFTFPRSPSTRGALPASPLLSRGTRRRATPCALGNYLRTTCGTCRPRGDRAPWTTDQAHNAQGKQSTSRLTSSPTIPTHASNCLSTHSPTSLSALPAQGPAVECAQSQQSVLSSSPNPMPLAAVTATTLHAAAAIASSHLTSPHFTLPFPCTD